MTTTCAANREHRPSLTSNMVALFDAKANKHLKGQALNPFSTDKSSKSLLKPTFSKEDYGRAPRGSLSEQRALQATQHICKEMLELCEIINTNGENLFEPDEKPDDPRKVISFGHLFDIYTYISDKLVGMLLRARKYKIIDFEGEVLFQRRDDHVPIILMKSMEEIREMLHEKIYQIEILRKSNEALNEMPHEEMAEAAKSS